MKIRYQVTKKEYQMNLKDLADTLEHIVNGNQNWDNEDYNFVMKRLTKKLPDWFDHQ